MCSRGIGWVRIEISLYLATRAADQTECSEGKGAVEITVGLVINLVLWLHPRLTFDWVRTRYRFTTRGGLRGLDLAFSVSAITTS